MVAKAEELVARLKSSDAATRLRAVKDVKNQIIGNRPRKKAFIKLEAIPSIVSLLAEKPESDLQIQCATVVGSLARLDQESAVRVLRAGGFELLLKMLESPSDSVLESALRALNFYLEVVSPVYGSFVVLSRIAARIGKPEADLPAKAYMSKGGLPIDVPQPALQRCVELLASSNRFLQTQAAQMIFYCAHELAMKPVLWELGVVEKLMELIETPQPEMVTDTVIMALCVIPNGSQEQLQWSSACVAQLLQRLKDNDSPNMQLDCCACIALMCGKQDFQEAKDARRKCLTVLAKLVLDWRWPANEFSPFSVLSKLLALEEDLKQAARDSGIVQALASRLACPHCQHSELEVPFFETIALLVEGSEEGRKQLLDAGGERAVRCMLEGMQLGEDPQKTLACFACMRGLSRSASYLRQLQAFFREAVPLCLPLISTEQPPELQSTACALLSNLLLSFSPAREVAWSEGCIEKLAAAVDSTEPDVANYALFALGNAARCCKKEEREQIMAALKDGSRIKRLAADRQHPILQVRAMVLLQNLTADCQQEELCRFVEWVNLSPPDPERLLLPNGLLSHASGLEQELQNAFVIATINMSNNVMLGLDLWCHLDLPVLSMLVEALKGFLQSGCKDIITSALWLLRGLINPGSPNVATRLQLMQDKGLWEIVEHLSSSGDVLDVKERAATVLEAAGRGQAAMQED